MELAGRPVETDLSPAAWVTAALAAQEPGTVSRLVPPVFRAYARVFHPAVRYVGDDDVHVSWAEVAAANGTAAHPLMEWASVTGSVDFLGEDNQTPLWDDAPARGHLPEHVAAALARVLRRHTGTPDDCWFGLSTHAADDLPAPELAVPGQGLWLVRGPVELAAANFVREPAEQSASAWWPADRAWFVATDIDLMSTYLGGSAALVAELLADPALEVVPATARQSTAWDADPVNPLPGSARP